MGWGGLGRGGDGKAGKGGKGGKGKGSRAFGGGGYASFGDYMVDKNRKLKEQFGSFASGLAPAPSDNAAFNFGDKQQFDAASASEQRVETSLAEAIAPKPGVALIFKGLTFWMTGRTCLPDQELKRLIVERGGIYEQYGFTKVTHVIADNVAIGNQMWRELKKRTRQGHIIKSQWIVDCVREGRRIPEMRYMPDCLKAGSTMLSFLGSASSAAPAPPSVEESGLGGENSLKLENQQDPSNEALFSDRGGSTADNADLQSLQQPALELAPTQQSQSSDSDREERQTSHHKVDVLNKPAVLGTADEAKWSSHARAQLQLLYSASFDQGIKAPSTLQKEVKKLAESCGRQVVSAGCSIEGVTLRITLDPFSDWSCSAELPKSDSRPADVLSETALNTLLGLLEGLASTAVRVLSLDAAPSHASNVRQVEVHLSVELRAWMCAASTATLGEERDADVAQKQGGTPPHKCRRVADGQRKRWRELRTLDASTTHEITHI